MSENKSRVPKNKSAGELEVVQKNLMKNDSKFFVIELQ